MRSWHSQSDGNPSALLMLVFAIWVGALGIGLTQFHDWLTPTLLVWGMVAVVWIGGNWVQQHSQHD